MAYTVNEAATMSAVVTDGKGNLIRTLASGAVKAGANSVTWDRTDNTGKRVGNGTYQIRITAAAGSSTASATVSVTAK